MSGRSVCLAHAISDPELGIVRAIRWYRQQHGKPPRRSRIGGSNECFFRLKALGLVLQARNGECTLSEGAKYLHLRGRRRKPVMIEHALSDVEVDLLRALRDWPLPSPKRQDLTGWVEKPNRIKTDQMREREKAFRRLVHLNLIVFASSGHCSLQRGQGVSLAEQL